MLKWLTNIFSEPKHERIKRTCDYCLMDNNTWYYNEKLKMTICVECIKKIADKVLKGDNN